MIVIYNPLILIEAAVAGGVSFGVSKAIPQLASSSETLIFLMFLAGVDLVLRYWLIAHRRKAEPSPTAPISPAPETSDWSWIISLKGGHLLFVPSWAIAIFGALASRIA
jgi:hypothetical protein